MILPLYSEDLAHTHELQPTDWPDMFPHLNFYINAPFCFPLKLVLDTKIVAIGTTIIHEDVAWLAHIIVHPDYRNKGLGKKMTQALIDSLNTSHCRTIWLIATPLGEPVYRKIGFEAESDYLVLKGEIISQNSSLATSIKPFDEKYRDQIFQLDRIAAGENRAMHLNDSLPEAFIFIKGSTVEGFYLPTLRDGLIVAANPVAGIELMKLRLTQKNFAVLPAENEPALAFLESIGFKEFKQLKRMWLGKKRNWQPTFIYNRVSGQIG